MQEWKRLGENGFDLLRTYRPYRVKKLISYISPRKELGNSNT